MNVAMRAREQNEYNSIAQEIQGKTLVLDDDDIAELQEGIDRIQNAHEHVLQLIARLSPGQAVKQRDEALVKQWNAVRSARAAAEEQLDEQRTGYEKALVDVRTEEREYREKLKEALMLPKRMPCVCRSG
jgi:hypothetical protein